MKKLWLVLLLFLTACSTTVAESGPSIHVGDKLSLGLHMNSNGDLVLVTDASIPIPGLQFGPLVGINWDASFETVLHEAERTSNYLYLLWEGKDGQTYGQKYDIRQPFDITFEQEHWVRRIKSTGDGNIVAYIEIQEIPQVRVEEPISAPPPAAPAAESCGSALPSRLSVGMNAEVSTNGMAWQLSLRSDPSMYASQVHVIAAGRDMVILQGPVCAEDSYWWYIRSEQGFEGWAREGDNEDYWIDPR